MRISGINIEHVEVSDREKFLKGKMAKFCGGKVRRVTEEEIKAFEKKWGKDRETLLNGFYFVTWIERR